MNKLSKYLILLSSSTFISFVNQTSFLAQASEENVPLPEMVFITGGLAQIGSLSMNYHTFPILEVELKSFYISKHEITFSQFDAFTEATGKASRNDAGWGRGDNPVIDVSWDEAREYADWLTKMTGENYRLPTEAEWEFVARANNPLTQYSWGNEIGSNQANCRGCGSQWDGKRTSPVGSFEQNSFGVFDMHGNVWEFTANCYTLSQQDGVLHNEIAYGSDCKTVSIRGGSWDTDASMLRVWYRDRNRRDEAYNDVGFRLVKEAE